MTIERFIGTVCALVLTWLPQVGQAEPPIWEPSFGAAIESLTGQDDAEESVTLSFSFPFDGSDYTVVFVGTNGDIQLGSLGNDGAIDFNHWSSLEDFLDDGAPTVAGFNSDLVLTTSGTIHFNDFGDRAVFTWNEVGTFSDETALLTFQITLHSDGTIVLGFNGILDGPGEFLVGDGIVVGVTAGDIPRPTDPGTVDLNGLPVVGGTTNYERWCCSVAVNSCGFGETGGLVGPSNDAFDLDQQNVVFTPVLGGFAVPEPASPLLGAAALLTTMGLSLARRGRRAPGPPSGAALDS